MLVLPIETHGDVLLLEDDISPDVAYVALTRPRVARRPDGSSAIRLARWMTTEVAGPGQITGGRLTVDIDVQPTADDLRDAGLAGRDARPLPWLDASIRIDGPQFDPVDAEVATAPGAGAALAVDLTAAAAGLLASLLQGDTVSPLQVTWLGHVRVRLPPAEVIATADVNEIRRRLDLVAPARRVTVISSIIDANARVEIRGSTNPALEQALRDWAVSELAARLAAGQSLDVHVSASDVVRWPIELATTLDGFIPSASRRSLVDTIVLDPGETGRAPAIEVRVLGEFDGPLERVDLTLAPLSAGNGVDLSFTTSAPRDAAIGTTEFRWRSRVKLEARPPGDWSPWQEVHGASAVIVPVSTPSSLRVEVLAAGIDLTERWSSVRVVLTHTSPDGGQQSGTIDLTAAQTSRIWEVPLDGQRGTLKAALSYVARQGPVVEQVIDAVVGDQVVVGDPLQGNGLRFALLPAGTGWNDVAVAMVDMRYLDGAYVVNETVELRRVTDFVEWTVPARAGGPETALWRLHASFSDGRFSSADWQTASRGATVIRIDGVPARTVQILPIYFDPAVSPSITLRLRGGAQIETVVVTDRTQRSVTLGEGSYSWTLQWTKADGSSSDETTAQEGEDVLVVPRLPMR